MIGLGLRNPWRFSFDTNGDLYIGDVGQGNWEEINHRPNAQIGRLANYGWNRFEGRTVFDSSNPLLRTGQLVFPTWQYSHAGGACSITGGYVYRGSAVPGAAGRYFYGDYCNGRVWSFAAAAGRVSATRRESFTIPSLSSFGEDETGELVATSLDGSLYALTT
jgi:hypothetical protein